MVWGGICLGAPTELVVVNGALNADGYILDKEGILNLIFGLSCRGSFSKIYSFILNISKKSNAMILLSIVYSLKNLIIYRGVKTALLYLFCM